jgi:MFS family permease
MSLSLRPSLSQRRESLALGHAQGILWAIGNSLTSGSLLLYLSLDLGASGLLLSLILAAPAISGTLRIFAPWVIRSLGGYKRGCLVPLGISYVLIVAQPAMAIPSIWPFPRHVGLLVTVVCLHQLLEYVGTAVFLGWLGDLAPRRVRGRYFARRQMLQLSVTIPALLVSGAFADAWKDWSVSYGSNWALLGYALPSAVGVLFLQLSLVPILNMSEVPWREVQQTPSQALIVAPVRDWRFRGLLLFGCWVAIANGWTQAAQSAYPKNILDFGLWHMALFRTTMLLGQLFYSHFVGPFSDRFGNRPVLIVSQAIVAIGPFFYLLATPDSRWWLWGAWIAWSAFAGLNICLPTYILKISSSRDHTAYLATYFGITSLCYSLATVAGGRWYDALSVPQTNGQEWPTQAFFSLQFLAGGVFRIAGVFLLLRVSEPGAWTWKRILSRSRMEEAESQQNSVAH